MLGYTDFREALRVIEGCEHCLGDLITYVSRLKESPKLEYTEPLWSLALEHDFNLRAWGSKLARNLKCPVCGHRLALGDLVAKDIVDVKNAIAEEVAQVISERHVAECGHCNEDIIQFNYRVGSETHDVWDLLRDDLGVPEDIYDEVLANLRCRCGHSMSETDPYVTDAEIDDWYGVGAEAVVRTFDVQRKDMDSFVSFLTKYPMLSTEHPIGKKIAEVIRQRELDGFTTLRQGNVLFRARIRNTARDPKSFERHQIWAPPPGVASQGRFNPPGIAVLYLAKSIQTALREVRFTRKSKRRVADVGEFILARDVTVWDMSKTDLGDFVSVLTRSKSITKSEYFFANFLAQCCTSSGVAGILYGSVEDPGGVNVALLNYDKDRTLMVRKVITDLGPVLAFKPPKKRRSRAKPVDPTLMF